MQVDKSRYVGASRLIGTSLSVGHGRPPEARHGEGKNPNRRMTHAEAQRRKVKNGSMFLLCGLAPLRENLSRTLTQPLPLEAISIYTS